jgi:hypothetical protein
VGVREQRCGIMLPKPEGYNFVVWALVVSATFIAFSRNRALSRVVLFFALALVVGAVIWWVVSFL